MAEFSLASCSVDVDAVPAAAAEDLVAAVTRCDAVVRATRLAGWVAEGRPVTGKGVLRPADVSAVARVLRIDAPARVRSAADVRALHQPWQAALSLGLLVLDGGRVVPGPVAGEWPPAEAGPVLHGWLGAVEAVCAEASTDEDASAVRSLCRFTLGCLGGSGATVTVDWLRERVSALQEEMPWHEQVPWHHAFARARDVSHPMDAGVDLLESFGAVTCRRGRVAITDSGRWLVGVLEARRPVPADAGLSATELLARLVGLHEAAVDVVAGPWIDARGSDVAARQLLDAAESGPSAARLAALELVDVLDERALPSLRKEISGGRWKNLAPHVRAWCAAPGMGQEASRADYRWIVADHVAAELSTHGPAEALAELSDGMPGGEAAEWLAALRGTGHPDAEAVAAAVDRYLVDHPELARPVIYQLKITLVGMRPPVWRQVHLAATSTLGTLHEVIQVLFDWDDDHLHVFTVGRRRYSGGFVQLDGARDEGSIRLTDALPRAGSSISYTYDLGDDWRHEITLERVLGAEPGTRYPVCVGGRGDAPLEDWRPELAGEDGFDPVGRTPYEIDAINQRLAALTPAR
jgi:hypothetical protein